MLKINYTRRRGGGELSGSPGLLFPPRERRCTAPSQPRGVIIIGRRWHGRRAREMVTTRPTVHCGSHPVEGSDELRVYKQPRRMTMHQSTITSIIRITMFAKVVFVRVCCCLHYSVRGAEYISPSCAYAS